MNIVPELGEHGISVGKTGSGKTTTNLHLLMAIQQSHPAIIIDSKTDNKFLTLPNVSVHTEPSTLRPGWPGVQVYRPDGLLNTVPYLDAVLQRIYDAGVNTYVYLDELAAVTRSVNPGVGLSNLLQRGRERFREGRRVRVSVLMSTQRPARVPFLCFSEATHFYVHRLQTLRDRKTMVEHLGDEILSDPLDGHSFFYYTHSMQAPVKGKINLGGK